MSVPFTRLGRVVKTHGLNGEVVLALNPSPDADWLMGLDVWIVPPPPGGAVAYRVVRWAPMPRGIRVTLEGIDSLDAARTVVGHTLLARTEAVPEDHTSEADLVGYEVLDVTRGPLGVVRDTIVTGANDVLVVDGEGFGEVLLPVIPDVMLEIDGEARRLTVRLLPGLIDEDSR